MSRKPAVAAEASKQITHPGVNVPASSWTNGVRRAAPVVISATDSMCRNVVGLTLPWNR